MVMTRNYAEFLVSDALMVLLYVIVTVFVLI